MSPVAHCYLATHPSIYPAIQDRLQGLYSSGYRQCPSEYSLRHVLLFIIVVVAKYADIMCVFLRDLVGFITYTRMRIFRDVLHSLYDDTESSSSIYIDTPNSFPYLSLIWRNECITGCAFQYLLSSEGHF